MSPTVKDKPSVFEPAVTHFILATVVQKDLKQTHTETLWLAFNGFASETLTWMDIWVHQRQTEHNTNLLAAVLIQALKLNHKCTTDMQAHSN